MTDFNLADLPKDGAVLAGPASPDASLRLEDEISSTAISSPGRRSQARQVVPLRPGMVLSRARNGQDFVYTALAEDIRRPATANESAAPNAPRTGNRVVEIVVGPEEYRPVQKEAKRVLMGIHALSAVDAVATISCVSKPTCKEMNPLYGRNPSALRVIGTKAAGMFLTDMLLRREIESNPWQARKTAYIGLILQGLVSGFTLSSAF